MFLLKKKISFFAALIPFAFLIFFMGYATVFLKQQAHIPLLLAAAVAAVVAMLHGYKWKELERCSS